VRRSPRVLLAWSAAVVVALTTARVVGGDLATLHSRAASLGPRLGVVVAVHDLELGQTVRAHDVRVEKRYATDIPSTAVTHADRAVGRVVVVPVLRDAMLFTHHLAAANRSGLDAVVPVGDRAVHVVPKDGFRPPLGSIVDVLAAFDPTVVTVEGAGNSAVVVAGGARVLEVDDADSGSSDSTTTGVTLLVTDTEARVVAFAAASADLTLAVAPPESACCADSRP
jgi:Flp pilus assembly protein CpaB